MYVEGRHETVVDAGFAKKMLRRRLIKLKDRANRVATEVNELRSELKANSSR